MNQRTFGSPNRRRSGNTRDRWWERSEVVLGAAGSFGLVTIVIFVIGRMWTTSYFRHLGLQSSGLEFTTQEYVFQSLEVFISLSIGFIGFAIAYFAFRPTLRNHNIKFVIGEAVFVVAVAVFVLEGLQHLDSQTWLMGTPGLLGLINGIPLAAAAWLITDLLMGPPTVSSRIAELKLKQSGKPLEPEEIVELHKLETIPNAPWSANPDEQFLLRRARQFIENKVSEDRRLWTRLWTRLREIPRTSPRGKLRRSSSWPPPSSATCRPAHGHWPTYAQLPTL